MKTKKIVLFDFDGVLVDSFELSYQAAREAGAPVTRERQRKLFEGNLFESLKGLKNLSADHEEQYYKTYTPRLFETAPMEGIAEVLEELGEVYQLVLVSSTISSPIQGYLGMHGLARHFDWVMGGDVHKSKTVKIQMVLKEYKAKSGDCVFITDTLGDMREAAKCEVRSIGVTWGFHEKERLQKGDFFALVDRMEDLPPAVHSFFA